MTMPNDPSPDLIDICVVLNEATDAPLGTSLLPYAERCKAIVIEGLAREAEEPDGHIVQYLGWTNSDDIADWLRSHLPSDS